MLQRGFIAIVDNVHDRLQHSIDCDVNTLQLFVLNLILSDLPTLYTFIEYKNAFQ